MLLSSIYPPGVYFQGVEGTALTRRRARATSSSNSVRVSSMVAPPHPRLMGDGVKDEVTND